MHPVRYVQSLGIHIDADLIMRTHVVRTVYHCIAVRRQLRQVHRSVPLGTFQALISALVLTRLDYANSVLVGLPAYFVQRLKSFLNASARLIYGLRRHDHVSDALITLHWPKISEQINFKLVVLVHRSLHHGVAPEYLGPLRRVVDLPGRRSLRSTSTNQLVVPFTRLTFDRCSLVSSESSCWTVRLEQFAG